MTRDNLARSSRIWAKRPQHLEYDQAAFHAAQFGESPSTHGVDTIPAPRDAHWTSGSVERGIKSVKEMFVKRREGADINTRPRMFSMLRQCSEAINALDFSNGYSLEQWVLGMSPKLPLSLAQDAGNLAGHQKVRGDPQGDFTQMLKGRERARVAFHKMDNSTALRSAMLQPPRRLPPPVDLGRVCHFWRRRRGPRSHRG